MHIEYTSHVKRTLLQIGLLAGVFCAAVVLAGREDMISGLFLGTTSSVIYFLMVYYRIKKSASQPPNKAVAYMRSGWLMRLAFIVLILILSTQIKQISFPAVVIGLFTHQFVIILNAFYIVVTEGLFKKLR